MKRSWVLMLAVWPAAVGLGRAECEAIVEAPQEVAQADAVKAEDQPVAVVKKPSLGDLENLPSWGKRIKARLIDTLAKQDIEPVVTWDGDTMTVFYHTRSFQVHEVSKTGEVSEKTRDQVGPGADGFRLSISRLAKDAALQADTPQTIQEPYWKTSISVLPQFDEPDANLLIRFSYGSRVEDKQAEQIKRAVQIAVRPAC